MSNKIKLNVHLHPINWNSVIKTQLSAWGGFGGSKEKVIDLLNFTKSIYKYRVK